MNAHRLQFLCIEIYKRLNDLNPSFMKESFEKRKNNRVKSDSYKLNLNNRVKSDSYKLNLNNRVKSDSYKLNLNILGRNQVKLGTKSLTFYGSKIWNSLPVRIKTAENLHALNKKVKWRFMQLHCLGLFYPPHFVYDFSRKIFLLKGKISFHFCTS